MTNKLLRLSTFILLSCLLFSYFQIVATGQSISIDNASPTVLTSTSHPFLLFHNLSSLYGPGHITTYPWSVWVSGVKSDADEGLTFDYTKTIPDAYSDYASTRGYHADTMAFEYLLTGDMRYLNKSKEALLNLNVGNMAGSPTAMKPNGWKAMSEMYYCLAYDWIQPQLNSSEDATIRDNLAIALNSTYYDLTYNGTDNRSIQAWDFHIPAYCTLGIGSVVLSDWSDPHSLHLKTGPSDWYRVGTYDLFVNDDLHYWYDMPYNRSMISNAVDSSGRDLKGSYKEYYTDDLALWAQIYSYSQGKNMLSDYPIVQKIFTQELWTSLPDKYSTDYVTDGNVAFGVYGLGIANLLDSSNKSAVLNNAWLLQYNYDAGLLPYAIQNDHEYYAYSHDIGPELPPFLYIIEYGDYSGVSKAYPTWTSHFDAGSIEQVFRGSWSNTSDYLSLITFNQTVRDNRELGHEDQLSFEYYSKGDLLLADAGEDRNILGSNSLFGAEEVHHNTIAIEDPRTPFTKSVWANSPARGIFKGDSEDSIVAPTTIQSTVNTPWMEAVCANVTWSEVSDGSLSSGYPTNGVGLSSSIGYGRTVLYPDDDYFVVVDRAEGSQSWVYRDIFRPSSLSISPSVSSGSVGHVDGSLFLNGSLYNWQGLSYNSEVSTGVNTSLLVWDSGESLWG